MEYSHSDPELLRQPIGYWSWAAYKAVVTRTRAALADYGVTQPQWWVLARLARAEHGTPRSEVLDTLGGYLDVGAALEADIDDLDVRGLVTEDVHGRLTLTPEGEALHAKTAAVQDRLWAERHAGISDAEYLTTLKVLQRFIHNTGGAAWHH